MIRCRRSKQRRMQTWLPTSYQSCRWVMHAVKLMTAGAVRMIPAVAPVITRTTHPARRPRAARGHDGAGKAGVVQARQRVKVQLCVSMYEVAVASRTAPCQQHDVIGSAVMPVVNTVHSATSELPTPLSDQTTSVELASTGRRLHQHLQWMEQPHLTNLLVQCQARVERQRAVVRQKSMMLVIWLMARSCRCLKVFQKIGGKSLHREATSRRILHLNSKSPNPKYKWIQVNFI